TCADCQSHCRSMDAGGHRHRRAPGARLPQHRAGSGCLSDRLDHPGRGFGSGIRVLRVRRPQGGGCPLWLLHSAWWTASTRRDSGFRLRKDLAEGTQKGYDRSSSFCRKSAMTPLDPIRLEVLKNRFTSLTEEMGAVLMRTSFSP